MSANSPVSGVVVGVDGSPSSSLAVQWAVHEAQLRDLPLTIVCVNAPLMTGFDDGYDAAIAAEFARCQEEQGRAIVDRARQAAEQTSSPGRAPLVTTEVIDGAVVPTLVELSENATLMVVGCRGVGVVSRALLGSVSSGLVHHSRCPVAVIHSEAADGLSDDGPVVVGIDGSAASELATEVAFGEASRRRTGLVAVHAWSDLGPLGLPPTNWSPIEWRNIKEREEKILADWLTPWQQRYPDVSVRQHVVCDQPAPRLLEAAHGAQLLVVGSHGRGGFTGMLIGSVSSAVVNSATVPVIVARHSPENGQRSS